MNRFFAPLARSAATIAIVIAAALVAIWMWNHYERSPWTRDGRVRADVVRVTPDIGGLVTSVAVRDNQEVKAGDLLFVIDRPRYALALQQADAQVASARATLGQARREAKRDRDRDYIAKRDEYMTVGLEEYWIIDRFHRRMTIVRRDQPDVVLGEKDVYRTPLLPGFELPLKRLLDVADELERASEEPE